MPPAMTPDIPSEEVERVAAGLTSDQRTLLLKLKPENGWFIFTYWCDDDHRAMQELQITGIFDRAEHWNARWNVRGLALRTYLERTAK